MGVSEGKEKECEPGKVFEKIMTENIPILAKQPQRLFYEKTIKNSTYINLST